MEFVYSIHWEDKRKYHPEITDYVFEYAIIYSKIFRDKLHKDVFNAICRIPPSGRIIKVVYRKIGGNKYKIITAFWLD